MNTEAPRPVISLIEGDAPGQHETLVVEEATLPMLLLRDLPAVLRDVREPISTLQRFLLQAAVEASLLDLHDAQQASSVPLFALRRIAWEFARAGLFVADQRPGCFVPNDELCRRSLEMNRVELEKPGRLSLVFLPESDEVFALDTDDRARKFVVDLQNCTPDAGFPTPALEGMPLAEFLQRRLSDAAISGLPADFLRFELAPPTPMGQHAEPACPLPASIPAFRVGFTVVSHQDRLRCRLKLLAIRKPAEPDISAAHRLLSTTMAHAAVRLPTASVPSLQALGMPRNAPGELVFESPVRAVIPLDRRAAEQVSAHDWLTRRHTLRVQHPQLALTTRAALSFTAADAEADRLFAIDEVARAMTALRSPPSPQSLRDEIERVGRDVEPVDVVDRLWQCREFACVHAIRFQEDLVHA